MVIKGFILLLFLVGDMTQAAKMEPTLEKYIVPVNFSREKIDRPFLSAASRMQKHFTVHAGFGYLIKGDEVKLVRGNQTCIAKVHVLKAKIPGAAGSPDTSNLLRIDNCLNLSSELPENFIFLSGDSIVFPTPAETVKLQLTKVESDALVIKMKSQDIFKKVHFFTKNEPEDWGKTPMEWLRTEISTLGPKIKIHFINAIISPTPELNFTTDEVKIPMMIAESSKGDFSLLAHTVIAEHDLANRPGEEFKIIEPMITILSLDPQKEEWLLAIDRGNDFEFYYGPHAKYLFQYYYYVSASERFVHLDVRH